MSGAEKTLRVAGIITSAKSITARVLEFGPDGLSLVRDTDRQWETREVLDNPHLIENWLNETRLDYAGVRGLRKKGPNAAGSDALEAIDLILDACIGKFWTKLIYPFTREAARRKYPEFEQMLEVEKADPFWIAADTALGGLYHLQKHQKEGK